MASATPLSKDTERNVATSDPNPGSSGDWTVRRNVDRWKRGGNSESGAGDQMGTSGAPQSDIEKEDRMRMVIHQLYGTQTHYQAAQKFLKNRTLRKMNDNGGMTLYDRIMAYRRLKGEEEADEEQTGANSPKQRTESQRTSPAKGRASRHSPAQRPSSGRGSVRPLDRSDTSFASVDISDLTQLDEEKNRSPSPQPTFENRPNTRKVGAREEGPPPQREMGIPPKKAWTDSAQDQGDDDDDPPTPFDPPSPVIKQLQPAYVEVPRIVASNYRYSAFRYLLRSQSVPDITSADTSDNLQSNEAGTSPRADHGNYRERLRKRRSFGTSGQGLSLAQRVCWARRVKAYIAARGLQRGQGGHDYEALTTARDVQLHVDDSGERVTDRRAFSAEERSAVVTTAAVATAARAHTSNANSHEDKRQERTDRRKVEREEVHEEKSEKVRKEKSEEVHEEKSEEHKEKSQKRSEHKTKSEEREENIEETVKVAAVTGVAVSESSREERSEKEKVKRKEKHKSKKKHSESVNEKETSDEKREDKAKSGRNSSRSSEKETSFIEQVSDTLEASETGSGTPEPSKTPDAPVIEAAALPVATAAPAAAAAAPKPRKSKSRAKSARKKGKEEEDTNTIAALDKLADKNLNSLLGNDDGGEDSEVDQEALDKVFNPKFQAELDNFLRTT